MTNFQSSYRFIPTVNSVRQVGKINMKKLCLVSPKQFPKQKASQYVISMILGLRLEVNWKPGLLLVQVSHIWADCQGSFAALYPYRTPALTGLQGGRTCSGESSQPCLQHRESATIWGMDFQSGCREQGGSPHGT